MQLQAFYITLVTGYFPLCWLTFILLLLYNTDYDSKCSSIESRVISEIESHTQGSFLLDSEESQSLLAQFLLSIKHEQSVHGGCTNFRCNIYDKGPFQYECRGRVVHNCYDFFWVWCMSVLVEAGF